MNCAEAAIVKYFHPTQEHAENCIRGTSRDAEHSSDADIPSVLGDAQWAYRIELVEIILLDAFQETKETANLDQEGLIAVADGRLGNEDGLQNTISKAMESMKRGRVIPPRQMPRMCDIRTAVRTSLGNVKKILRGEVVLKKPKSRKKTEDPERCFLGSIGRGA